MTPNSQNWSLLCTFYTIRMYVDEEFCPWPPKSAAVYYIANIHTVTLFECNLICSHF